MQVVYYISLEVAPMLSMINTIQNLSMLNVMTPSPMNGNPWLN